MKNNLLTDIVGFGILIGFFAGLCWIMYQNKK